MNKSKNVVPPPKKEEGIKFAPCIECKKPIVDGYFGSYADGGVCSKVCDVLHMQKRSDEMFSRKGD